MKKVKKKAQINEIKDRSISLLSKKFILFFIVFIIATVFRWFDKMPANYTVIVWIGVPTIYAFWNVVNKLINQITLKDIKDVLKKRKRITFENNEIDEGDVEDVEQEPE